MTQPEIFAGLDIGSQAIKLVVTQFSDTSQPEVIAAVEDRSEGVSRMNITNIEDAVSSISNVLEQAERMTGLPITRAVVGISGTHIKTTDSSGVVAVSRADREITPEDVERSIESAQTMAPAQQNHEVIHVIPKYFVVDSQSNIKDPVGMTGTRLEAKTQIIMGLSANIKNLTKCVYRTGVDISDLVFNILACAESTLTKRQKELGVALVNLGSSTTSLVVFEEGDVLHTAILPVGANHVTADVAIGLRIAVDAAETIKLEVGQASAENINKREEIDLSRYVPSEKPRTMFPLKDISDIIQARQEEIFSLVNKELKKINRAGLLPAGVILTGGGAKLNGIIDLAKDVFKLPVFLGLPQGTESSPIDKANDPIFTTALGLALWQPNKKSTTDGYFANSSVKGAIGTIQNWFKHLLP